MTNEDKAFAFANKNADKYINDEDPLNALRDGFLCGAQWKEKEIMNPWHKVSNKDLPKETILVCARGFLPLPLDWCETLNGWLLAGDLYKQEDIAERWDFWMKILELPKED